MADILRFGRWPLRLQVFVQRSEAEGMKRPIEILITDLFSNEFFKTTLLAGENVIEKVLDSGSARPIFPLTVTLKSEAMTKTEEWQEADFL